MLGEIIIIGDELISGQVRDSNAHYLSSRFSSLGFTIASISVIGDNAEHIRERLDTAAKRSEFVLVCGGLGPTPDDITTQVASKTFNRPLFVNQEILEAVETAVKKRGAQWSESFKKLALLPEGAELIEHHGRTSGFYLDIDQVTFFFLPGIPEEVRHLVEKRVMPTLLARQKDNKIVKQKIFKVYGLSEAEIGEALKNLTQQELLVGYYPNFPENHVSITVKTDEEEKAARILENAHDHIMDKIGSHVVAMDSSTLEENLGARLLEKGLRLAVAESCTGGLITHRLTSVSGSSQYFERGCVVYSNASKSEMLGVPEETLMTHGAVSAETAECMARAIRDMSGADLGLATTGIAGPTGGTEKKPVGTVYIALAHDQGVEVNHFRFYGNRSQIKTLTAQTALHMGLKHLQP